VFVADRFGQLGGIVMKLQLLFAGILLVSSLAFAASAGAAADAKPRVTYALDSIMRYFADGSEKGAPDEESAKKFTLARTEEVDIDGFPLEFRWSYYDGLNEPVEFPLPREAVELTEDAIRSVVTDVFPPHYETLIGNILIANPLRLYRGSTDYVYSEKTTGKHEDTVIEQSKTTYDLRCALFVCEKGLILIAEEKYTTKRDKKGIFGLVKIKDKDQGTTYLVCRYRKVVEAKEQAAASE
jgi:hypothetical protein